jgi:hypothetical protein
MSWCTYKTFTGARKNSLLHFLAAPGRLLLDFSYFRPFASSAHPSSSHPRGFLLPRPFYTFNFAFTHKKPILNTNANMNTMQFKLTLLALFFVAVACVQAAAVQANGQVLARAVPTPAPTSVYRRDDDDGAYLSFQVEDEGRLLTNVCRCQGYAIFIKDLLRKKY